MPGAKCSESRAIAEQLRAAQLRAYANPSAWRGALPRCQKAATNGCSRRCCSKAVPRLLASARLCRQVRGNADRWMCRVDESLVEVGACGNGRRGLVVGGAVYWRVRPSEDADQNGYCPSGPQDRAAKHGVRWNNGPVGVADANERDFRTMPAAADRRDRGTGIAIRARETSCRTPRRKRLGSRQPSIVSWVGFASF